MPDEAQTISIADEFSQTPFGRYAKDGPEAGEVFREAVLKPALEKGKVLLDIDGLVGLPSSFWEEVMGGLVRSGFPISDLKTLLEIRCTDPELKTYVRSGWRYAEEASQKIRAH